MKIAIVHDFLKEFGGAERVVEALHEIYPEAPIFVAFVDYEGLGPHANRIRKWDIKTTWAQQIPFISQLYSPLRFLAPFFFRSLDLSEYDIIISSTNAYYAKGIRKRTIRTAISHTGCVIRVQVHICYCHTPPRSLYGYPTAMDWRKHMIVRIYGTIINHFLRLYDFKAAQNVDYFIANSEEVKRRIQKFYRRDSIVIYPPVDIGEVIKKLSNKAIKEESPNYQLPITNYLLYVGKLAYAKHVDLAILAANRLKIPLKIVGRGGEEKKLRELAKSYSSSESDVTSDESRSNDSGQARMTKGSRQARTIKSHIEFLGEVSDEELRNLYTQSKALIFPAENEDFGIVPVEAMAHGVPVIAHRSGGVVESIIEGKTGMFFDALKVESLVSALRHLETVKWDHAAISKHAQKFSKERFKKEIKGLLDKLLREELYD